MVEDSGEQSGTGSKKIDMVIGIAKAVPIYQDALQPAMIETGKALQVVGRAVNVALAPIRGLVWGAEQIEHWVSGKVSEKLADLPPEEIISPDLSIAGPTIEALKYNGHKPELSDMFASLLASAMRVDRRDITHPSFVEKIRLMTADDAKLFLELAKEKATPTINVVAIEPGLSGEIDVAPFVSQKTFELFASFGDSKTILSRLRGSLENLEYLNLIKASSGEYLTSADKQKEYDAIIAGSLCSAFKDLDVHGGRTHKFNKSLIRTTQIGINFMAVIS